ncbi:unannotated protein [freshwater metagenome]|uniref:Unannotated protein n=1 Tax=freshwater metagenome TaxID=449393 RepID=A0A6J7DCW5_9ZZZZ
MTGADTSTSACLRVVSAADRKSRMLWYSTEINEFIEVCTFSID